LDNIYEVLIIFLNKENNVHTDRDFESLEFLEVESELIETFEDLLFEDYETIEEIDILLFAILLLSIIR
jgi:hypothetical protein